MNDEHESLDGGERWYAVWTRSRQEKAVASTLSTLGVRHYLPLKSELRTWSDRKQRVEVPLFSGYVFVCMNPFRDCRLRVLKVPAVVSFVGNQTGPLPIPDQQIEAIRRVLTAGVMCSAHPVPKAGERVRVVRGPLTGVEGTMVRCESGSRLLISIDMVRQSLAVSVSLEDVESESTHAPDAERFEKVATAECRAIN